MGLVPVDEDTEALPVTAADVDGFITKSLDEVDIFFLIQKKFFHDGKRHESRFLTEKKKKEIDDFVV